MKLPIQLNLKKIIIRSLLIIFIAALAWIIHYTWVSFPIISAFGAKEICSCMFVSGRDKTDIEKQDLEGLPSLLGRYEVNIKDSSVTGTVLGMAKKKAIYRKGIGCTVINDLSEKELRSQLFTIPSPPSINTDAIAWPYGDKIIDTNPGRLRYVEAENCHGQGFYRTLSGKKTKNTRCIGCI